MRRRKGFVTFDEKEDCWIARTSLTDDNGKRRNIKRRAKSKSEAENKLATILRDIETEGKKVVDYNQMTFANLADFYEKRYLHDAVYVNNQKVSGLRDAASSLRHLRNFRNYFGRKKLREITHFDVQSYRDERLKTITIHKRQRTISAWNREACVLRRIFNIAVQQGWLLRNPFNCGDPLILVSAERRRERILTKQEEIRLLDACDSHPYRRHLKPFLIFLLDTGCRKSEALKLCWESVCFESRVITIEGMTTKTLKTRRVMMTQRLCDELRKLYFANIEFDKSVFQIKDNVRKSFASACKVAEIKHGGIDGITLHSLRHTAASRLVQKGMNPQMAGRLLGHSQPQTTYRYLSADLETMQQAASILENL